MSLLAATHKVRDLAYAVAHATPVANKIAPEACRVDIIPNEDRVHGVLQGIQDHTSSFPWSGLIYAVGRKLKLDERRWYVVQSETREPLTLLVMIYRSC